MKTKIKIRLICLSLISLAFANLASAQIALPRISPTATIKQDIGLSEVKIVYGRPNVKGRKIWGQLVAYEEIWRTGSNECTIITFSDEVEIGGKKLPRGSYSLFTIPRQGQAWEVIFNKDTTLWGNTGYEERKDALRIKAAPYKGKPTETLNIGIGNLHDDGGEILISWEKINLPIAFKIDMSKKVMEKIEKAIAEVKEDDWRTYVQSAEYLMKKRKDLEKASLWADKAIAINPNHYWPYWVKADLLALEAKYPEAVQAGETAIIKGLTFYKNEFIYQQPIQTAVDGWKKQIK